jgi:hypothetical protein
MEEIKAEVKPEGELPPLLNRVEEFANLRTEYGVADLETKITDLKAQEDEAVAALRILTHTEEGKPVALNVIQGRVSEEERAAQERLDAIGRQKSRAVDELNTKYNIINQIMTLEGLDYNDGVDRYEKEFSRNLQLFDVISGIRKENRSAYEFDQQAARANLQIYVNAATKGNIDYGSLSTDQKLMISKLEVQSGLPIGFIGSIKKDPSADIIFTTSNEGVTQVGFRNADGSVSVKSYGTRVAGAGSETERKRSALGEMTNWLTEKGGGDKFVAPDEWNYAKQLWLTQGYEGKDFDNAFLRTYVGDPGSRGWNENDFNLSE